MRFEAKTYNRLGAILGSIIGVFAMMIAVCVDITLAGAILLIICAVIGIII